MAEYGNGRRRYKSGANMAARTAAQLLLLKPVVWSILRVHVHGTAHLDSLDSKGFLVIGNHSSHFDAPLIIGSMPSKLSRRLSTGAAADHFYQKWYTAMPTSLFFNAFPVDRTGTRSRRGMANQLLSDDVPLLLFPEGTRSRSGGMGTFKPGAAALSISHNVPVVPVAIIGAHAAWPPDHARWLPGRPEVHVVFGNLMMPTPGEIAHQFNERLRRKVMELHDSTARAYGMPTQDDMIRYAAIEKAKPKEIDPESR